MNLNRAIEQAQCYKGERISIDVGSLKDLYQAAGHKIPNDLENHDNHSLDYINATKLLELAEAANLISTSSQPTQEFNGLKSIPKPKPCQTILSHHKESEKPERHLSIVRS